MADAMDPGAGREIPRCTTSIRVPWWKPSRGLPEEFRGRYTGSFSILEFGVADGYSYTKKLYATKYLGMADRVLVHGFDSFEGMPSTSDERDRDMVADDSWVEGQYKGRYEALDEYCRAHYSNYRLHRGVFDETVNEVFLASLEEHPPILIWIDCDYYTSARAALEPLIPYIFQAGAWCTSTTSS